MQQAQRERRSEFWLRLIAALKLVKGSLLLLTAIGLLAFLHEGMASTAERWIRAMRFDPDNKLAHLLLARIGLWDHRELERMSAGTFVYAAVFLTEGIGLFLRKRWAEYLTVLVTGSFIPFEIGVLLAGPTLVKALVLASNVAIVAYLVARLRRRPASEAAR